MKNQNNLILIKHSLPIITPDVPARDWPLSTIGQQRCHALAEKIQPYQPELFYCSEETKAVQTAQILADQLSLPHQTDPNLHEHDRSNVDFSTKEVFERKISGFFKYPDKLVMGRETAKQAQDRFCGAVRNLITRHPTQNLAIVAHGTVITLLVAQQTNRPAFPFWQQLGLPSFVVFSLPDWELISVEEIIH